ncbi:MAG: hypothetical protein GY952_08845 [Rhodobacteraceae bacterium]|nr:hypothetical protein [Paracoccaceae bacterium]
MEFLNLLLAFSLIMIALSTVVSGIVEAILRWSSVRVHVLETAVKALCKDILWKKLNGDDPKDKDLDAIKTLARKLVQNPVAIEDNLTKKYWGIWLWLTSAKTKDRVDKLSTEAFVQRLAKTEEGQSLAEKAEEISDQVRDLALSFERYMAASSEVFRKKAHYVALFVSVSLAFAGNIDLSRTVSYLRSNPEKVDLIIADQEKIVEAHKATLEKSDTQSLPEDAGKAIEAIQKDIKDIKAGFNGLKDAYKLPIGWSEYPYNGELWETEPKTWCDYFSVSDWGLLLRWFFNTLAAGLLIGLGGPFWYRMFTSLSQVTQLIRGVGGGNSENIGDVTSNDHSKKQLSELEKLVDLFKIAAGISTKPDPEEPEKPKAPVSGS